MWCENNRVGSRELTAFEIGESSDACHLSMDEEKIKIKTFGRRLYFEESRADAAAPRNCLYTTDLRCAFSLLEGGCLSVERLDEC